MKTSTGNVSGVFIQILMTRLVEATTQPKASRAKAVRPIRSRRSPVAGECQEHASKRKSVKS